MRVLFLFLLLLALPVSARLVVKDDATTVNNVIEMTLSNSSLTDNNNGRVAVNLGAGASGVNGSVQFADSGILSSNGTGFTWSSANGGSLFVEGIVSTGGSDQMVVAGASIKSNFQAHSDTLAVYESHTYSATAGSGSAFYSARARGTDLSPAIVQDDDTLGIFAFVGHDGVDYAPSAAIYGSVDGTPGSNDMPGRLTFLTSADGSQTLSEAMRIRSDGHVGIATIDPLDELQVNGAITLKHISTSTDDHGLEIDLDAAGFGDNKAIDIAYITGAIGSGDDEEAILVNIDETASTGGDTIGLEVLATDEGASVVRGIEIGATISPLVQLSGVFENMDSALNNGVNALTEFTTSDPGGANNVNIFVSDNNTITIGNAAKFEEIEVVLETGASGPGIAPTFEFSTGVGTWSSFTPADGTNAFRNTGVIAWLDSDIPTWAVGTGSEYLIRVTRTRNSLSTVPKEDLIQISAATQYEWDRNGDVFIKDVGRDADNLIDFATDNEITFRTAANDRMTIDSSGEVGIGTATPGELLDVAGTAQFVEAVFASEVDDGNSGAADTIDWTTGNKHKSTLTGNVTYTFTAPSGPTNITLKLVQDATGSRTVTWPTSVMRWPGGTAPTLSTAANSVDILVCYFDGTNYYCDTSLAFAAP